MKKKILIFGGTGTIGFSIAKNLEDEGCIVISNGRRKCPKKSNYLKADVTKINDCKKLISDIKKKYGKLDILVCNVGSGKAVPTGKETIRDWEKMFSLNFYSSINLIKFAENELKKTKGSIICISSIAGVETTNAPITYSVAKSALNSYVKNTSKRLSKYNIRINAVAPGNIIFNGSTWETKMKNNPSKVKKMLKDNVSMNRFGTTNEISNLVTFLSSEMASFITGSIYVVDGGQTRS